MILSGHAPCYLPGIQLFNKIALSDVFIHCGHLQYQHGSWHSRNYIRTGVLSVPVRAHLGDSVDEAKLGSGWWRKKHIRAIELAYRAYPYFGEYFPALRAGIEGAANLGTLNIFLTNLLCNFLGIKTRAYDGARWYFEGDAIDKIIQMCKVVGATKYLSNPGAIAYIGPKEEARMLDAGIQHCWQAFAHPDYLQNHEVNQGQLSIIDLLFRHGPEAGQIVRDSGRIT